MLIKRSWLDDGLQVALDAIHQKNSMFVEQVVIKMQRAELVGGTLRTPKFVVMGHSRTADGELIAFFVWPDASVTRLKGSR